MVAANPGVLVEEQSALLGTWSGAGGGGWMILRADGTFRGAFLRDELINSQPDDTAHWKGTYQFADGEIQFQESSSRCQQEQVGVYRAYLLEDDTMRFELVEDECQIRINGILGQRTEPVLDLVWSKTSADAPHSVDWFRTIDLPFIAHDFDLDAQGNIYAIELGQPLVHKLDRDGNLLQTWGKAGSGDGEFAFAPPPDGPQLDGGFVVASQDGRVYVSDSYNNRVQIFNSDGEFEGMWQGVGPDAAPFNIPGPISSDDQGNIYVADFDGVYKYNNAGEYQETIPVAGEVGFNSQGDLFSTITFENMAIKLAAGGGEPMTWGGEGAGPGQFIAPIWLVVRPDDTVYISDHSGRMQRFDAAGNLMTMWNGPEEGDGPFTAPLAMSMDDSGNIYLAAKDRPKVYVLSQ
jgi:hypothetical protein